MITNQWLCRCGAKCQTETEKNHFVEYCHCGRKMMHVCDKSKLKNKLLKKH
jgi:hypothetical protein